MTPDIIIVTDHTDKLFLSKPMGSHKVADSLRRAGYTVQVINHAHIFSVDEIFDILQKLIGPNTLFVGFNTFFYANCADSHPPDSRKPHETGSTRLGEKELGALLPHGRQHNKALRSLIKRCNSNVELVLGGPDAQDAAYTGIFDYVILGYADVSVVKFADYLSGRGPVPTRRRSVYGSWIIDDRLATNYDFVGTEMTYTDQDLILPGETLMIEISRGCIFRCDFCSYPLNGKKKNDHVKLKEILLRELITNFERYKITRYMFSDDTLNDSPDKIKMIWEISQQLPFQLEYWAYIRLDLLGAHPETIDWLIESGCRSMNFGIESMNLETARIIGKGGSRESLTRTVATIRRCHGDQVNLHGNFIFGLPHESVSSMQRTAKELLNGAIQLHSWSVYPLIIQRHGQSRTFASKIDLHSDRYGYHDMTDDEAKAARMLYGLDPMSSVNYKPWKNPDTNFFEMMSMVTHHQRLKENTSGCITGSTSFFVAGNGFSLDYSLNLRYSELNWHEVDLAKQHRANQYRCALFELANQVICA